ncbi:MAG: DUF4296 domain-containing protein [Bacteroidaceae bacterium]|nr:DUF4296 domain-containing protein [Bacteroidaceae bacterium]
MKQMFKEIKHTVWCLVAIVCLSACTVEIPSYVIQPQEMEDLLYDYHLMQAMAGDLKSSEGYKRKQYEQYVFDKHHVTEAEFDTSLTWYMRHTKELEAIYKNLNDRFSTTKEKLAAHIPPYERTNRITKAGDTVNVWDDFRMARLTVSPLTNKLNFVLPTDSNYHKRDAFEWKLNAHFLGDTALTRAIMGLTLIYDKDTVGSSCVINQTGSYSLSLTNDSNYQLKEIHGHVYYYNRDKERLGEASATMDSLPEFSVLPVADLILSDIAIMRYHRPETVTTDTVSVTEEVDSTQSVQG